MAATQGADPRGGRGIVSQPGGLAVHSIMVGGVITVVAGKHVLRHVVVHWRYLKYNLYQND